MIVPHRCGAPQNQRHGSLEDGPHVYKNRRVSTLLQFGCITSLKFPSLENSPRLAAAPAADGRSKKSKTLAKSQMTQPAENDQIAPTNDSSDPGPHPPQLSKNAQKKLLKLQRWEAKKAEKKALEKEKKQKEAERKRSEWEEKLASVSEEEKAKLIESRREMRKERMEKRSEEKEKKMERLRWAKEAGQKIVVDLEFADLMSSNEIHSLVQQIMYCYAVNGRCTSPSHLWLTGCRGEIETQLQRLPGFDKWIIEKESQSYIEVLKDQKENLVYLTADAETVLDVLDPKKIYVVGGLVDRNRWKGITLKKAKEQGIQSAKLPIANYLKMSSSQEPLMPHVSRDKNLVAERVLTVNQVIEILLKFVETRDWQTSFFQVIPQRKRGGGEEAGEDNEEDGEKKRKCIEEEPSDD